MSGGDLLEVMGRIASIYRRKHRRDSREVCTDLNVSQDVQSADEMAKDIVLLVEIST